MKFILCQRCQEPNPEQNDPDLHASKLSVSNYPDLRQKLSYQNDPDLRQNYPDLRQKFSYQNDLDLSRLQYLGHVILYFCKFCCVVLTNFHNLQHEAHESYRNSIYLRWPQIEFGQGMYSKELVFIVGQCPLKPRGRFKLK